MYLKDSDRLAALARTGLLDSEAEPSFDRLARLASKLLGTPVALVSLVDANRQFFKSCVGLPEPWATRRQTPLSHSFCQHVVTSREPLVIEDARLDPQVKDNPAIAELNVIAYLGVPLAIDDQIIGSFCAIDNTPRTWTTDDVEILRDLAESVVTEIRLRADRSEMARQRTAAEDTRRRFQVTLSSIGDGVIATDNHGSITFMNAVAEALCGWSETDAIGRPINTVFRIVREPTREPVANPAERALAQKQPAELTDDTILIAKDGTERPISDKAATIKNAQGEIEGVVLVFRDITEMKGTGRRLSAYEARFRLIFESVKDFSIFTVDLNAIITSWNTGAENVFGYSENEAIGQSIAIIFTPEDRAAGIPERELQSAAKSGRGTDERWHMRKSGERFFASGIVTALKDDSDKIIGFTKVARDITAAKQADDLLRAQAAALKDADRRKDEFLAMLAHELRNPLAAISSGVQLVKTVQEPDLLSSIKDMIERQTKHLTQLMDDLLDVSRISAGKIILKKETVELASVIKRAVDLVRPLVDEKHHELTISQPEQAIQFVTDATRTAQILGNLLTNAAKYTEEGGKIHLDVRTEGDAIVFKVRDSGVGIPGEMLSKVFGLFTQVDSSVDRSQGGLGIGLTLVRELVEMHGGTVTAASEGRGKGSQFTVCMPIGEPIIDPSERATPESTRASRGGGRILVVDDNRDMASTTARLLSILGYTVETAHNGNEAIAAARKSRPDVVLLDIGLPGMSGYEVAARLRDDEACKDIALIAVSGYGEETARDRSRAAGFQQHLTKPLNFNELCKILNTLLIR
jgi:PAS domain S-box-containing protein